MGKSGVNKNGIHWVKDGKTYICYFSTGGIEYTQIFKDVKQSFINNLDIYDLK